MNKLLRNPWVVAGLVIGMAALWWVQMRSVLHPGMTSAEPLAVLAKDSAKQPLSSETIDSADTAESAETLAVEPLSARATAPTQLRWDSTAVRDPFGPVAVSTAVAVPLPVAALPVETVSVATDTTGVRLCRRCGVSAESRS